MGCNPVVELWLMRKRGRYEDEMVHLRRSKLKWKLKLKGLTVAVVVSSKVRKEE